MWEKRAGKDRIAKWGEGVFIADQLIVAAAHQKNGEATVDFPGNW